MPHNMQRNMHQNMQRNMHKNMQHNMQQDYNKQAELIPVVHYLLVSSSLLMLTAAIVYAVWSGISIGPVMIAVFVVMLVFNGVCTFFF